MSKVKIIGIVVIAVVVILALVWMFARGPIISAVIQSTYGIDPAEYGIDIDEALAMSSTCQQNLILLIDIDVAALEPVVVENPSLRAAMEADSGATVQQMGQVTVDGTTIIAGIMDNGEQCFATETEFCICRTA